MKRSTFEQKMEKINSAFLAKPSFRRPLMFGDKEQAGLLRTWRAEINRIVEDEERRAAGDLQWFSVEYSYKKYKYIEVEALDEEEARDIALDEIYEDDVEIEAVIEIEAAGAKQAA